MQYEFTVNGPRYPDWAIAGFELLPNERGAMVVDSRVYEQCGEHKDYFDREFAPAMTRSVDLATCAHQARFEQRVPQLILTHFRVWPAATTIAGIECAVAVAAWLTLGHSR